MSICLHCQELISGRSDKKFCTAYCKSAYHYQHNKAKESSLFLSIDKQLKLNRRLLKAYNKAGKSTVRKATLEADGFNSKYFTHYWKNYKGEVYLFCYEFGFREIKEHDKQKFVLVTWQDYMNV